MEITLTADNWSDQVLKSQTPIIVDFWAQWCIPCKVITPALSELAEKYKGRMNLGKLNVDEFPRVAEAYLVRGIPNLKIFKNGQIVDEIVGAVPKEEIEKHISRHL